MEGREFADLVAAVADAMGQRADAVRGTPDGLLLHTTDGFLFAFLEDPTKVSLTNIRRLLEDPDAKAGRLVLLTPGRLPLALSDEAVRGRASLVEHERFRELLRMLDLGERLGEEPRGPHDVPGNRLLPSARHLDAVTARARNWLEWGVPALALRFYQQALRHKPEFVPARLGVARSLQALGLADEAMAAYEQILGMHPGDVEARLGEATLHAAAGRVAEERQIYREILTSAPDRLDVRAQLIAAEIDEGQWAEARREIEAMLRLQPEDARIRYLHAAALTHTGGAAEGRREVERARALGLSFDQESSLAGQLGLPAPPPRPAVVERPAVAPSRRRAASATSPVRSSPPKKGARPKPARRSPRKGK
jgi:tetratricopeptide (TPR) repeat protein